MSFWSCHIHQPSYPLSPLLIPIIKREGNIARWVYSPWASLLFLRLLIQMKNCKWKRFFFVTSLTTFFFDVKVEENIRVYLQVAMWAVIVKFMLCNGLWKEALNRLNAHFIWSKHVFTNPIIMRCTIFYKVFQSMVNNHWALLICTGKWTYRLRVIYVLK